VNEHPAVSEREWALIIELLQRELTELPSEIHHTVRAAYRHELQYRRKMVADLLERLMLVPSAT
jgi:hypothetical protein